MSFYAAHKFVSVGVFPNDIRTIAPSPALGALSCPKPRALSCSGAASDTSLSRRSYTIWRRLHFTALIPSVDVAVQFFIDHFLSIINRHTPLRTFRVKNRNTPWFTRELSDLIHDGNKQWSLARKSNTTDDWLLFPVLRNKCCPY